MSAKRYCKIFSQVETLSKVVKSRIAFCNVEDARMLASERLVNSSLSVDPEAGRALDTVCTNRILLLALLSIVNVTTRVFLGAGPE